MTIKATLPVKLKISDLDPANISFADEYTVLEHLYSPLIELNTKGELSAGIAIKFEWVGNEAHFTIRDDLYLNDNRVLKAEDVLFSLKRLIVLDSNVHGKISDLLCPESKLKKIEDDCSNLRIEKNKLIVSLEKKNPFLFKILASIDYAIIPQEAVDPKTLKIKDYKISTGPYTLVANENGDIHLKANKRHYQYSIDMPQKVVFTVPEKDSFDLLKNGKIDVITTDDNTAEPDKFLKFAKEYGYEAFESLKIKTNLLMFTRKGLNRIDEKRRLKIGKVIRYAFAEELKDDLASEVTEQFFPALGEAGLGDKSVLKLKEIFKGIDISNEDGEGISIYAPKIRIAFIRKVLLSKLPKLDIITTDTYPDFFDVSNKGPDIVFTYTDTGFLEQISLISYSVNFGYFGLNKIENDNWLETYGNEEDKTKRLNMLEKRHLDALTSAQIVPLYHSSYVAVTNDKWKLNFSEYYSNTKLWLMRKK